MVRDKNILVFRTREQSFPNLYALPGTRKPVNDRNLYGHEMDAADCLVALKRAAGPGLVRWQRQWDPDERKFFGDRFGVWPDRVFELEQSEQVFYLEVDRGTEDLDKQIWPKVQDYIKLSTQYPKERFTVIFTAQGYRYHADDLARASELLGLMAKAKRGNQFLVTSHEEFLADPLGPVMSSPLDPTNKLTLTTL